MGSFPNATIAGVSPEAVVPRPLPYAIAGARDGLRGPGSESRSSPGELPLPASGAFVSEAQLASMDRLQSHWRLTPMQSAAALWMEAECSDHPGPIDPCWVQPETLARLEIAEDIDMALAASLGPELVPFWLRLPHPGIGASPLERLAGPTSTLRQVRWQLRAELAERRRAGERR